MVLYIIGLGLGDEKDVTIKGREALNNARKYFLRLILQFSKLIHRNYQNFKEKKFRRQIEECCESGIDSILQSCN